MIRRFRSLGLVGRLCAASVTNSDKPAEKFQNNFSLVTLLSGLQVVDIQTLFLGTRVASSFLVPSFVRRDTTGVFTDYFSETLGPFFMRRDTTGVFTDCFS